MYQSIFRPDLFKGKLVLVTGGGTGIGKTIACDLLSLGATVVIASRTENVLIKAVEELSKISPRVHYVTMNIRVLEEVEKAVKEVTEKYGRITHLVNNAGGQFLSPLEQISTKGFKTVVELNLLGTFNVCKAVYDATKGNSLVIVNIAVANKNGFPMMAHSGAARAGVENLAKSMAIEWSPQVRVNNIAAGTVIGHGMKNYPEAAQERVVHEVPRKTVMKRLGTEAEIASAAVFLLSPGSAYVTGETLCVDGGITLSQYPSGSLGKGISDAYIGYKNVKSIDAPPLFHRILDSYSRL